MQIIPRKEARNNRLPRYFTGKPCKRGHIAERTVASGVCHACQSLKNKKHWGKNRTRLLMEHQNRLKVNHKVYNQNAKHKYHSNISYKAKRIQSVKDWYQKNRESVLSNLKRKEQTKQYRQQHKKEISNTQREWRKEHREHINSQARQYQKKHRAYYNAQWAKYNAQKIQATPSWIVNEEKQINELYFQAKQLTKKTGIIYEVDHIIPLRGKTVCGLHCCSNLQIITRTENRSKLNKLLAE